MVTFEDAMAIVAAKLLPEWDPQAGTFHVAKWGWQTKNFWCLAVGAREYLVQNKEDFATDDDKIFLVNKETGEFVETTAQANLDLISSLDPYGDIPKNFQ